MGCCFSRTLDRNQPHHPGRSPSPGSFDTHVENFPRNRTPEEETVKEVLSETPIAKPRKTSPNFQEDKSEELKVKSSPLEEGILSVLETSQVTEWCSNMSESVSLATTISEKREGDDASSKQRREIGGNTKPMTRRKRPYPGNNPSYRREQRDKCSAKKTELLAEKKSGVSCRYTQGTTQSRESRIRKVNGGHEQQSGVSHGRGSRSPAAGRVRERNKTGNVKSSATNVTERAGDPQETVTIEKRDEEKVEEKPLDSGIQPPNESIESPVVSLECFIFL